MNRMCVCVCMCVSVWGREVILFWFINLIEEFIEASFSKKKSNFNELNLNPIYKQKNK
jgi:hypothetical protein